MEYFTTPTRLVRVMLINGMRMTCKTFNHTFAWPIRIDLGLNWTSNLSEKREKTTEATRSMEVKSVFPIKLQSELVKMLNTR